MVRVCKDGGVIGECGSILHVLTESRAVLLEHGLGTWRLLNWFLNYNVEHHFQRFGCRYNKDIESLVKDIEGVDFVRHERFDYGTVHLLVARKKATKEDSIA